jgi:hypothetical protein
VAIAGNVVVAVGLTLAFSIGRYAWAVYGSSVFKVYVVAIVLAVVPMMLMSVSAMILPCVGRSSGRAP